MAKGGRPSDYTQETADYICAELAQGRSLRSVCNEEDMPHLSTIFRWFRQHEEFCDQYARAKDSSADSHEDIIEDVAQRVLDGQVDAQAARVAIDAYKWTASKLKPKKYGDRLDLGNANGPLQVSIVRYSDEPNDQSANLVKK